MIDFQPTESTRLLLEEQISELNNQKDDLILQKRQWELKMSLINDKLANKYMLNSDFQQCQKEKIECKQGALGIETMIFEIKKKVADKQNQLERVKVFLKQNNISSFSELPPLIINDTTDIIKDLHQIKATWMAFSSDHTRVNSMRLMAAKFAEDLNVVIKKHKK